MIITTPLTDRIYQGYLSSDYDFDSFRGKAKRAASTAIPRRRPIARVVNKVKVNRQIKQQNRTNNFGLMRRPILAIRPAVPVQDPIVPEEPVAEEPIVEPEIPQPDPENIAASESPQPENADEQAYYFFFGRKNKKRKKGFFNKKDKIAKSDKAKADVRETSDGARDRNPNSDAGSPDVKDKKADAPLPAGSDDKGKEEPKTNENPATNTNQTTKTESKKADDDMGLILGFGCLLLTAGIAIYAAVSASNAKKAIMAQYTQR